MKGAKKLLGVLVFIIVGVLFVPNSVKASEMSDEFKKYLNEDGEFEVNAAKGTEEDLAMYLDFKYTNVELPYSVCWDKVAEDLSSFEFGINCWDGEVEAEKHTVKLKFKITLKFFKKS